MKPNSMHERSLRPAGETAINTCAWITVVLSALLLPGCNDGPPDDSSTAAAVNPYPPGQADAMFFRSPSQWQDYAAAHTQAHTAAAEARRGD